jgi:hypothetical protein
MNYMVWTPSFVRHECIKNDENIFKTIIENICIYKMYNQLMTSTTIKKNYNKFIVMQPIVYLFYFR